MKMKNSRLIKIIERLPRRRNEPRDVRITTQLDLMRYLPFRLHRLSVQFASEGAESIGSVTGKFEGLDDIRVKDWRIMVLLATCGPLTNAEISSIANMNAATISRAVAQLVELGIAVSRIDPGDKRKTMMALTPKGAKLFDQIAEKRLQWVNDLEACLTSKERELFYSVLDKFEERLAETRAQDEVSLEWDP